MFLTRSYHHVKILVNALFIVIITVTVLVSVMTMKPLIALPVSYLVIDGLISGFFLAVFCFLLKSIVQYSHYSTLSFNQRVVNYSALAVLFVLCWMGMWFFSFNILVSELVVLLFLPTLPLRIVIAVLIYAFVVVYYKGIFYTAEESQLDQEFIGIEAGIETETMRSFTEKESILEQEILEHVAVKNRQKIDIVLVSEIILIQAEGDYVMIHTTKGKFLKEQTMKYFTDHLPKGKFVRIHRSHIVNIDFIQNIELYDKQNQIVKLKGNFQVKMSITGYKELRRVLKI